jgi:hypothetical protein
MTRINHFINPSLVKADIILDYVPVVSTVTNLVDLCQKCILKTAIKPNPKNVYATHLNNKSFLRCALLLVPVIGNVLNLLIYDPHFKGLLKKKDQSSSGMKKPLEVKWNAANQQNQTADNSYLQNLWQAFEKNTRPNPNKPFFNQLTSFLNYLPAEYSPFSRAIPTPTLCGNPMLSFRDSQDVFFIPHERGKCSQPAIKADRLLLIEALRASFGSGKKMVVTQLANDLHVVAAGFMPNGEFKIIDSMGGKTVDIKALTKALNEAKIKNSDGKPIKFKGEYVNTHIQKGGHECVRFSMLYCYQMAKKLDLNAFEEVNGAFIEGKLVKYENFSQIETVKKVKDVSSRALEYKPFMHSWALRICGFSANDWKQIPLSDLKEPGSEDVGELGLYVLQSDDFPKGKQYIKGIHDLILEDEQEKKISILEENFTLGDPLTDSSATIESLSPKVSGAKHYLIFQKGKDTPHLFCPQPDQKLYSVKHYKDGRTAKFPI